VNPATIKNNIEDKIKWNWDNMHKIKERLSGFGLRTIIDIAAMCELDLCCGNLVQQRFVKKHE
jgi:5'-3' exonuclease